ncbi:hypothetical protein [Schleiferia thermophila]|jgi:hypothetical protein|uniref:Lipoprotein n=1 Tax=Schleiferia thermophila TaxID=884107 RepID=A0A369A385_9FLAO|nr:hypothetical protein [Schleiferia thermophila]KFD38953.1 hypothetical protein AT05_07285 [Schleiferia thermophila str. Yellowstone]RCX03665.1 hypothetical protein DES35_102116 [Schleiferia thermophila]GCD79899.1 hypothetical protein JCM30197_11460 [Schleiferia thermophila]
MKTWLKLSSISSFLLMLCSCATLFSSSTYPVHITSSPYNVSFDVYDRFQNRIHTGRTPEMIYVSSSYLPFIRQKYTVLVNDPDFESQIKQITFHLDGWYLANLLFPPLAPISLLVIDPLSGAMYTLDRHCRVLDFQLKNTTIRSEKNYAPLDSTSFVYP